MKEIVKILKHFGHDYEIKEGKVFGELYRPHGRGMEAYWTEIKNREHYEELTGKIEEKI